MNIFVDSLTELEDDFGFDLLNLIYVIDDLGEIYSKNRDLNNPLNSYYIIHFNSNDDIDCYIENVELFSFIFNIKYFTISSYPVFKTSNKISTGHLLKLAKKLNLQGYPAFYYWLNDKIHLYPRSNPEIFERSVIEYDILKSNMLKSILPFNYIHCRNYHEIESFRNEINEYLKSNQQLSSVLQYVNQLYHESDRLNKELTWTKNTLNNYMKYNDVIKRQLSDNRLINYGSKFANYLRRISYLRKLIKTLQN